MTYFAAVLCRIGDKWTANDAEIDECESLAEMGDLLRDCKGDIRLLVIEQDDEYAAIIRLDDQMHAMYRGGPPTRGSRTRRHSLPEGANDVDKLGVAMPPHTRRII